MRRSNDARLALPLAEWPEADRAAWRAARTCAGLFAENGAAARWKPKTAKQVEKGYALWLGFLGRRGLLDPGALPGARLTEPNLRPYVADLQCRVAPQTIVSRLRDLSVAVRVMDPGADRSLLQRALRRLSRDAVPRRDKRARLVTPRRLRDAGLARMARVQTEHHPKIDVTAGRYRDGLMMALLACVPVRLGELARMRLGHHLRKAGERYLLAYDPGETKAGRPTEVELPMMLTPWFDRYLEIYRPVLLRGQSSDAVWISTYRDAMSEHTISLRFCAATREEIGMEINPHLARDIVATGIAEERPDLVGILPMVLDHADDRTVQKYYNHARRLVASRVYSAEMLAQVKEALAGPAQDSERNKERHPCAP